MLTDQFLFSGEKIEIPEDRYKADFELHDRFQNFSNELMRLSLAGITATGIFLTILAGKKSSITLTAIIKKNIKIDMSFCFKYIHVGGI